MRRGAVFFYQGTAGRMAFSAPSQPTLLSPSSPVEAPVLLRNASIGSRRLMSAYLWQGRVETEGTHGKVFRFKFFALMGTDGDFGWSLGLDYRAAAVLLNNYSRPPETKGRTTRDASRTTDEENGRFDHSASPHYS